ncbi:uncharacterized protein EV420DRAFT_1650449 [Desarmillaria tabescens]|uniref:Uncharacterized protein n=1 Tax=Armillaria tabescens TaxID=1929756 RepID=A0AA39JHN9_ARMTA|nr:uncharacterized protein EV420DRAFT_1650449 [Desarmillaria tabescens]KAK0440698.1 hypothetical protein EV420DRAFT_1650449 [Desarmillaria tabescens]
MAAHNRFPVLWQFAKILLTIHADRLPIVRWNEDSFVFVSSAEFQVLSRAALNLNIDNSPQKVVSCFTSPRSQCTGYGISQHFEARASTHFVQKNLGGMVSLSRIAGRRTYMKYGLGRVDRILTRRCQGSEYTIKGIFDYDKGVVSTHGKKEQEEAPWKCYVLPSLKLKSYSSLSVTTSTPSHPHHLSYSSALKPVTSTSTTHNLQLSPAADAMQSLPPSPDSNHLSPNILGPSMTPSSGSRRSTPRGAYDDIFELLLSPPLAQRYRRPSPRVQSCERLVSAFTIYRELKCARLDKDVELVFRKKQEEWTYVAGLHAVFIAINTAVLDITPDSQFAMSSPVRLAIARPLASAWSVMSGSSVDTTSPLPRRSPYGCWIFSGPISLHSPRGHR